MTWQPPDVNTISEGTAVMHEYYISLREAGFTEHQALSIVMGSPCCKEWCAEQKDG